MPKGMVLNELSLQPMAQDRWHARARMEALVRTLRAAVGAGAERALRMVAPLDGVALALDYSVPQWRNDEAVERELRQYFRSLALRAPILADPDPPATQEAAERSEFKYEGVVALGLGSAFLLPALALSLGSDERWKASRLSLGWERLDEDGSLLSESVEARHASKPEHVSEHSEWLVEIDLPIQSGLDLWQRREELFPALGFCSEVERQLGVIGRGPLIESLAKRLQQLDAFFRRWNGGAFDGRALPGKIHPESLVTLQRYPEDRSFRCPDGVVRLFSWHMRVPPGSWRLYFHPDPGSRRAFIGYLGPHLQTVDHPA